MNANLGGVRSIPTLAVPHNKHARINGDEQNPHHNPQRLSLCDHIINDTDQAYQSQQNNRPTR